MEQLEKQWYYSTITEELPAVLVLLHSSLKKQSISLYETIIIPSRENLSTLNKLSPNRYKSPSKLVNFNSRNITCQSGVDLVLNKNKASRQQKMQDFGYDGMDTEENKQFNYMMSKQFITPQIPTRIWQANSK